MIVFHDAIYTKVSALVTNNSNLRYYAINVGVAIATFVLFTFYARKYQYRQRDEICDVYRYAEDYYSNVQEESNYD